MDGRETRIGEEEQSSNHGKVLGLCTFLMSDFEPEVDASTVTII